MSQIPLSELGLLFLVVVLLGMSLARFFVSREREKAHQARCDALKKHRLDEERRLEALRRAKREALRRQEALQAALAPLLVTPKDMTVALPLQILLRSPEGWWSIMPSVPRRCDGLMLSPLGSRAIPTPTREDGLAWYEPNKTQTIFTPQLNEAPLIAYVYTESGVFELDKTRTLHIYQAFTARA